MRIYTIILLCIIVHVVLSAKGKQVKKPKPRYPKKQLGPTTRPRAFTGEVTRLISSMANENGYRIYDKCHILPWKFIRDMVVSHWTRGITRNQMRAFIKDLGSIHTSATYYKVLRPATKARLYILSKAYTVKALAALEKENSSLLLKYLFNMPSNLYPGNSANNRSIKDNLDPPKEGNKRVQRLRTKVASKQAKKLYKSYKRYGLTTKPEPNGNRIKTSDKPPGDRTGDYVTI